MFARQHTAMSLPDAAAGNFAANIWAARKAPTSMLDGCRWSVPQAMGDSVRIRNWPRFWLRRFFRLAPAYYLAPALATMTNNCFLGDYHELQKLNRGKWPIGGIYDPMRIRYTFGHVMLHVNFIFIFHFFARLESQLLLRPLV